MLRTWRAACYKGVGFSLRQASRALSCNMKLSRQAVTFCSQHRDEADAVPVLTTSRAVRTPAREAAP